MNAQGTLAEDVARLKGEYVTTQLLVLVRDPARLRAALAVYPEAVCKTYIFTGEVRSFASLVRGLECWSILAEHGADLSSCLAYSTQSSEWIWPIDAEPLAPWQRKITLRLAREPCHFTTRSILFWRAFHFNSDRIARLFVRAGMSLDDVGTQGVYFDPNFATYILELRLYAEQLAQQRRALIVLIGLRRHRRSALLQQFPLEIIVLIARNAWLQEG